MKTPPNNWPQSLALMHERFGVRAHVRTMSPAVLMEYLNFRISMIQEELDECRAAVAAGDADGVVDALVDGMVFALGTLDTFEVDAQRAWDCVLAANMSKLPGSKPERPNRFGFPDMIKPHGWTAPSHVGNTGLLDTALSARALVLGQNK